MALSVRDLLRLEVFRGVRVVAGAAGLDREVRWVHIWPEVLPWFHGGELLLTTGYSWPAGPRQQRRIVGELDRANLAAILFATGRFFPSIPRAILTAAERVDLPILEAPSEIAFAEVTEVTNREIIRRQYEVIERSELIQKTLTAAALEARDLSDICHTLSRLIRRSVAIDDAHFRRLAEAGWPHGRDDGPAADSPLQERLEQMGIIAELKHARSPLRIADLDGQGEERIACPIRIAGELVGYLWVAGSAEPLTDLDVRAAEHGAVVAALHILRQQAVATVEARVRHTFVEALIQGELGRTAGLQERARLLGFDPEASYLVGLLTLLGSDRMGRKRALSGTEEFHLRERLARALRLVLEAYGLPAFLGYVLNQVVFLLPADGTRRELRTKVTGLWERLQAAEPHLACAMVLGGVHHGAEGVARSYAEADRALIVSEGEGVFWYEDLFLLRVLQAVTDAQALRDLVENTLGRLRASRRGEALIETVRALAQHGFRQRMAARAMGVHWNTLRHRITRIEELLDRPLSDPQLQLALQLALEVERVHSASR